MHRKGALFTITFYGANISIFFYTATFFCFFMISPATFPPPPTPFQLNHLSDSCTLFVRYLSDDLSDKYRTNNVQRTYNGFI